MKGLRLFLCFLVVLQSFAQTIKPTDPPSEDTTPATDAPTTANPESTTSTDPSQQTNQPNDPADKQANTEQAQPTDSLSEQSLTPENQFPSEGDFKYTQFPTEYPDRTPPTTDPSLTASLDTTSGGSASGLGAGAIAGATIGAVGGVALAVVLALLLKKLLDNKKQEKEKATLNGGNTDGLAKEQGNLEGLAKNLSDQNSELHQELAKAAKDNPGLEAAAEKVHSFLGEGPITAEKAAAALKHLADAAGPKDMAVPVPVHAAIDAIMDPKTRESHLATGPGKEAQIALERAISATPKERRSSVPAAKGPATTTAVQQAKQATGKAPAVVPPKVAVGEGAGAATPALPPAGTVGEGAGAGPEAAAKPAEAPEVKAIPPNPKPVVTPPEFSALKMLTDVAPKDGPLDGLTALALAANAAVQKENANRAEALLKQWEDTKPGDPLGESATKELHTLLAKMSKEEIQNLPEKTLYTLDEFPLEQNARKNVTQALKPIKKKVAQYEAKAKQQAGEERNLAVAARNKPDEATPAEVLTSAPKEASINHYFAKPTPDDLEMKERANQLSQDFTDAFNAAQPGLKKALETKISDELRAEEPKKEGKPVAVAVEDAVKPADALAAVPDGVGGAKPAETETLAPKASTAKRPGRPTSPIHASPPASPKEKEPQWLSLPAPSQAEASTVDSSSQTEPAEAPTADKTTQTGPPEAPPEHKEAVGELQQKLATAQQEALITKQEAAIAALNAEQAQGFKDIVERLDKAKIDEATKQTQKELKTAKATLEEQKTKAAAAEQEAAKHKAESEAQKAKHAAALAAKDQKIEKLEAQVKKVGEQKSEVEQLQAELKKAPLQNKESGAAPRSPKSAEARPSKAPPTTLSRRRSAPAMLLGSSRQQAAPPPGPQSNRTQPTPSASGPTPDPHAAPPAASPQGTGPAVHRTEEAGKTNVFNRLWKDVKQKQGSETSKSRDAGTVKSSEVKREQGNYTAKEGVRGTGAGAKITPELMRGKGFKSGKEMRAKN